MQYKQGVQYEHQTKLLVILGPTASGKSEFAVKIARKFNGEIISADSRQVYRGMDIGTGKVPRDKNPKTKSLNSKRKRRDFYYKGIRHHLIDVVSPKRVFTAARYKKLGQKALNDIFKRGNLPIICGGTGFYIDTLLGKVTIPDIPPNSEVREKLEKQPAENLYRKLQKLDPARAKTIDSKNRRRLSRALEIVLATGVPVPAPLAEKNQFSVLKIGVSRAPEELKKRIAKRLRERIQQGLVAEVKRLHKEGVSWKRLHSFGLEYRFVSQYLQGIISKKEMAGILEKEIWRYAKRQMTWFRRDKDIVWTSVADAEKLITKFAQGEQSASNFFKFTSF